MSEGNMMNVSSKQVATEPVKKSHILLEDIISGQEEIILELQKLNKANVELNKNLAIVGQALITMMEKPAKVKK